MQNFRLLIAFEACFRKITIFLRFVKILEKFLILLLGVSLVSADFEGKRPVRKSAGNSKFFVKFRFSRDFTK